MKIKQAGRWLLRTYLLFGILSLGMAHVSAQQKDVPMFDVRASQLTGPAQQDLGEVDWLARLNNWKRDTGAEREAWLAEMRIWRSAHLARMRYDDSQYSKPDLKWTQQNFVQTQAMVEDRYLYDPLTRTYTVDRFLDDLKQRYGGIDSVLLWPVYPNMGVDDRNQFDMLRDMPGGIDGLRQLVVDFHKRGVRVFFPTMPWDEGSRDEGESRAKAIVKLMTQIGADGINGDTMDGLPIEFHQLALDSNHPLALEPELAFKEEAMLVFNLHSWGYWETPFVPLVSKWKWLEPRHVVHVCDRWATDRTQILQAAFFNGTGVESWENVWGWWNQFTDRDAAVLKRISTIYRAVPELLSSPSWTPHEPTLHYGVYASRFPSSSRVLWTMINRNGFKIDKGILKVEHRTGSRYFDMWNGLELQPHVDGKWATIDIPLEANGYGAVLQVDDTAISAALSKDIRTLQSLAATPLHSLSNDWKFLPQTLVDIAHSMGDQSVLGAMVTVPAGEFEFRVTGVEIEGENRVGMDFQYPWEESPRRSHYHRMALTSFQIDRHPVTNVDFKQFLDLSKYAPEDDHNFLRDWSSGAPNVAESNSPVTWVALDDARAYCRWAGKRLPHEWEWQYAAQGTDSRNYPWGNSWREDLVAATAKGRNLPALPAVGQHPEGASPFGVEDMVGIVWQWTDEYVDAHMRTAVLRGGSFYQPQGSSWYFPQAYKLSQHGKYLLMSPGKDRAGAIGFRCVRDI